MHYTYYAFHNIALNFCVGLYWQWFPMMSLVILFLWMILPGQHTSNSDGCAVSVSFLPMRQRAMAHLRPVSIPDIVRIMAGKNPVHEMADFDRHFYMPGGLPSPDASARGNADDHRSELKRKVDGNSSSLRLSVRFFAYLTHGTASLEEVKKLLTIITNVHYIVYLAGLIFVLLYQ
jgi:hypothetical protein